MDSGQSNDPSRQADALHKLLQDLSVVRFQAELETIKEVLCKILEKQPDIIQGLSVQEYIEKRTQERINSTLAGMADISPAQAATLARLLIQKKIGGEAQA